MEKSDLFGVVYDEIELSDRNLMFLQKLADFDCALVLDEQGTDKHGKAGLAVARVLGERENPSILIITTHKLMYSWYRELITYLGADFKFLQQDCPFNRFLPGLQNLFITSPEEAGCPVFADSSNVWDMVIIDGGLSKSGIRSEKILESFNLKTKKLVVFAPYLACERSAAQKLVELPQRFLADEQRAAYFGKLEIAPSLIENKIDSPFMRFFNEDALKNPKITEITYEAPEDARRIHCELSKMPQYYYGGNVCEELNLDIRHLYVQPKFDDEKVIRLCEYDKKLGAFMQKLEEILADPNAVAVTYFCCSNTLDYVRKVIATNYHGFADITTVRRSNVYDISGTTGYFSGRRAQSARIILALDEQNEQCGLTESITHVINYELPTSPLTLNRRYLQGGRNGFASPEFVYFRDKTDDFDGRMLAGSLALNICDSFAYGLPSRNILLSVEGLDKILASVIRELADVEYADNERLSKLMVKYNMKMSVGDAKWLLGEKHNRILNALEIQETPDGAMMIERIKSKLKQLTSGFVCLDEQGRMIAVAISENDDNAQFERNEEHFPEISEKTRARELLSNADEAEIIKMLRNVSDSLKPTVCLGVWRYLVKKDRYKGSYIEFLKHFNEGVM